ncbi:MAG TPA: hypothetical protein PLG15_00700 [Candidatus Gastranaerophilaceae bacterium]|nr:hypothetical protein [Candidatus Gastranaerophilaceae bacterium]HPT40886.1 hypothetical protein [Candidatus Gastranaerophilaceae bacterium]
MAKDFDYKGYSEEKLLRLCDETKSDRGIAKWKYWSAEVYSFGRHIRDYAFYPSAFTLYCFTDHGAGAYFDEVAKHELESDAPCQFYHSPLSVELFKKVSNKPCYTLFSPFVWYRRKNKIEKISEAKGTLAFPIHSTHCIDLASDMEIYIEQLKALPEEFQPVSVCLHHCDINKGQYKLFFKHNIPVYTAGDMYDQNFAQRFYDILKNFRYSTSNAIGSYTYYSVEMGIPFSIYGEKLVLMNNSDSNLEKGECKFQENPQYQKIYKMFEGLNKQITPEQKEFVEKHLGIYDGISRLKMAKILYLLYLKKGNPFKDLSYALKMIRRKRRIKNETF